VEGWFHDSPRTVEYQLYKVFPKLGVASRGELARLAPLAPLKEPAEAVR
jgi:DNA-binding CsgD family transcriptional regulator